MIRRVTVSGGLACVLAVLAPAAANASSSDPSCVALPTSALTRTVVAGSSAETWPADPTSASSPVGKLTAGKEYRASEPSSCTVGWMTDLVSVEVDDERLSVSDARVYENVDPSSVTFDEWAVKAPGTWSAGIFSAPTSIAKKIGTLTDEPVRASSETWSGTPVAVVGSGTFKAVQFDGKHVGYVDSNILIPAAAPDLPKASATPSLRVGSELAKAKEKLTGEQDGASEAGAAKPETKASSMPNSFVIPLAGFAGGGFIIGFAFAVVRLRSRRRQT